MQVEDDDFVIVSPGTKHLVLDSLLWGGILGALLMGKFHNWLLCVSPHPGGAYPTELIQGLNKLSDLRVRAFTNDDAPTSHLIPGCNLFISSYSTTGIEAAAQQKPVIDYLTPLAQANWKRVSGTTEWGPAKNGLSHQVNGDVTQLIAAINHLMGDGGRTMKERQKTLLAPERDATAEIIAVLAAHAN
jgi:hypothetical protein